MKSEIKRDLSTEMNGVIQILINSYKETKIRIISAIYTGI